MMPENGREAGASERSEQHETAPAVAPLRRCERRADHEEERNPDEERSAQECPRSLLRRCGEPVR